MSEVPLQRARETALAVLTGETQTPVCNFPKTTLVTSSIWSCSGGWGMLHAVEENRRAEQLWIHPQFSPLRRAGGEREREREGEREREEGRQSERERERARERVCVCVCVSVCVRESARARERER